MFFIIGWGHPIKKTVGPIHEVTCANCNNTKHWILEKSTEWVTLFFIPIIPSRTQYYVFCPICQQGKLLSKEEFNEMVPLAELNNRAMNTNMSEEEYEHELNKTTHGKTF